MRLRDVQGVDHILAKSPLREDPLWDREVADLTQTAIQLFYARAGLAGLRNEAVEAIERIQAAAVTAAFKGQAEAAIPALIAHEAPPDPYLVDEFVHGLAKLQPPRRKACLFALTMRMDPKQVTTLTWDQAKVVLSDPTTLPLAREIIEDAQRTRHIRLPYVFWEWATPRIAAPLMDLQCSIEQAFLCAWPNLVEKHARMVMLDRHAEAASFLQLCEEANRS